MNNPLKICLSTPGTNAAGKRVVDLSVDGMGFGYIVFEGDYTVDMLAAALGGADIVDDFRQVGPNDIYTIDAPLSVRTIDEIKLDGIDVRDVFSGTLKTK